MRALVVRTEMIGCGTAYEVLIPRSQKGYRPITAGIYATVIMRNDEEYYRLGDFLRTPDLDNLLAWSDARWDAFRRIGRLAERLEAKIATRVFPELKGRTNLPFLWASWTLPSAEGETEFVLREKYCV